MKIKLFVILFLVIIGPNVFAQDFIEDLIITTDSSNFSIKNNTIDYRQSKYLYFVINSPDEIVHIEIIPKVMANVMEMSILPGSGIEIIDPLIKVEDNKFEGAIKFTNILNNPYSRLAISAIANDEQTNRSVRLYPYIFPEIPQLEPSIEIYSGQEVLINLPITNQYFLKYNTDWIKQGIIDYRIINTNEGPKLALRANRTGSQPLIINVESSKPFLNDEDIITTHLFDLHINVIAIFSKVNFLNFDKRFYYFEPQGAKTIIVQFDNNPNIKLNRTYRIEDQEQAGGRLVGELFTRAIIENQNKVVAALRTYALHRTENGFLYMKLDDNTQFFTNFNIVKKPEVTRLSILRTAKDWTTSHIVYPGETIELKFEGTGLNSSVIKFSDGKYHAEIDTSRISESVQYCTLTIPVDVKEKSIPITLNGGNTAYELLVKEYERPRPLDFVTVNYGDGPMVINGEAFLQPALFKGEIGSVVIQFNEDRIDELVQFYGTQYMEVEIRYWDKNKKLIESREIEDIKIVPSKNSIRHEGYNLSNASNPRINFNDIMVNKTHELKPWTRIEILVRHNKSKYDGIGYSQLVQIYRSEDFTVGVEVSFPAGLLAKRLDTPGVGNLTGLSVASMAQISFYKKGEINKLNPLSLGVGFIMMNAFNSLTTTEDTSDIGMVSLLRFQPLRSESKVNFPIYAGFGYLFKAETMFLLIGPGIQFNF